MVSVSARYISESVGRRCRYNLIPNALAGAQLSCFGLTTWNWSSYAKLAVQSFWGYSKSKAKMFHTSFFVVRVFVSSMRCCHLALPRLLIHAAGLCATETPAKCKICLKILIVGMRAQNGPKTASSGCKKREKKPAKIVGNRLFCSHCLQSGQKCFLAHWMRWCEKGVEGSGWFEKRGGGKCGRSGKPANCYVAASKAPSTTTSPSTTRLKARACNVCPFLLCHGCCFCSCLL